MSVLDTIGKCGLAFVNAILQVPALKAAVCSLITFELANIAQALLIEAEKIEKLDAASRFLDRLFTFVREETAAISRSVDIASDVLDEFKTCPAVNVISNQISNINLGIEKALTEAVNLITGQSTEKISDINNLMYEAQKRVTLRNQASAGIRKLEEARTYLLAFREALGC